MGIAIHLEDGWVLPVIYCLCLVFSVAAVKLTLGRAYGDCRLALLHVEKKR